MLSKNYSLFLIYKRNKSPSLNYASITLLFRLFSHFSDVKNPNALYCYKEIIQSLIDNHSDVTAREFYFLNFLDIFSKNQQIPPGLLLEPLIK